jgi:hypothetical protein
VMLEYLGADGPFPAYESKLMLFGQFVGSWDIDSHYCPREGEERRVAAAWHFGWILDGRGVQDVLYHPRDKQGPAEGIGTTVRVYVPETGKWRVVWLAADSGNVVSLTAGPTEDGILIEGENRRGLPLRWRFSDITAKSFYWHGYISYDHGESWHLEQEMWATRLQPD